MDKQLSCLTRTELDNLGFGSLGVEEVTHCYCTLPDGCRLALRVWAPSGSLDIDRKWSLVAGDQGKGKFPTVLEYLPYRKADWTAQRDHRRHPWLASHGYVVVRADMRGSGDSDGVYFDEYLQQEQEDCVQLIDWISKQPWSSGKVGMYGKSWGGFNGLQVAFCQPPALSAIITLYSTDNRFEDDIHWKGGCVLGGGMLSWAATMFCWDARPPQPQYNSNWKEVWKNRLEMAGECLAKTWLDHQTYDDYWKHGSIEENTSKVAIPVLAIGGWHDGYTNCALRMAQTLPKCQAIVGPWSHNWPDEAVPGPNIGFMDECLAWWDQHLKGMDRGYDQKAKVRWFLCNGVVPPGPSVESWPGQWQAGERSEGSSTVVYTLSDDCLMKQGQSKMSKPVSISFSGSAGLMCGEWLSFGAPDLPGDQRVASQFQACWFSETLETDFHIFGQAAISVECEVDKQVGQIYCGLCHVMPDGGFRLITYGLLNLNGLENGRMLTPGKVYTVKIMLDAIGYTVPAGQSLLLMVSPGNFPTSWPSPLKTKLTLHSGSLSLPLVSIEEVQDEDIFIQTKSRLGPSMHVDVLRKATFDRKLSYGLSDSVRCITTKTDEGCKYYPDVDTEIDEVNEDRYTITGDDPTSAVAFSSRSCLITYQAHTENPIKTETMISSWMKADQLMFNLTNTLVTRLDGVDFFTKTWQEAVPRNGV